MFLIGLNLFEEYIYQNEISIFLFLSIPLLITYTK